MLESNGGKMKEVNSEKQIAFYKALLSLHGDIETLTKDEANPFFKSKYVPLPKMLRTLKPVFQKHGFVLNQPIDVANTQQGMRNVVFSRIVHAETGLSEEAKMMLPDCAPTMKGMQELGGAVTYARRYTLSALLGLEEADDDGNTATGKKETGSKYSTKDRF